MHNTAELSENMYCWGAADSKSPFCLGLRAVFQHKNFSLYGIGRKSIWSEESWVVSSPLGFKVRDFLNTVCASSQLVYLWWTQQCQLFVDKRMGRCSSVLTTMLWRVQRAALHASPQMQNSLTCIILLIGLLLDEMSGPFAQEQIDRSSAKKGKKTWAILKDAQYIGLVNAEHLWKVLVPFPSQIQVFPWQLCRHIDISRLLIYLKKLLKSCKVCFRVWHHNAQFTGEEAEPVPINTLI